MRVALLTWFYPPGGSGLGRAAHMIAHGLRETGCSVSVITASKPLGFRENDTDVEIIGCAPPEKGVGGFLRRRACGGHLVAPWHFQKVVRDLRQEKPFDIIEATNWYAPAALLTSHETPIVIRNSTPAIDTGSSAIGVRNLIDLRFAHALEAWTARRASALISNTVTHHRMIEQTYRIPSAKPHSVVELALDPTLLARSRDVGLDPVTAPRFLFIGRDERRKGFREMLEAFVRIVSAQKRADRPAPCLTIVGVDEDAVSALLTRNPEGHHACRYIRCFPAVADETLHDLYEEASIVLAPSRYESYGLVYREAAAFGRPLVACAEDPAAVQFVERANCGVLAKDCSAQSIQTAIELLSADLELQRQLSANGRQHAPTLTRRRLGEETLKVYRSVLAGRQYILATAARTKTAR
ncbi:glycosyltransferase family 4 protein [Rhodophyticola sp.]|uniref:glycosyltransferase family 4 protein n=1 Tax=Rhodophyticola sp. TaxID=2680032 RepID=UPI003D2C8192